MSTTKQKAAVGGGTVAAVGVAALIATGGGGDVIAPMTQQQLDLEINKTNTIATVELIRIADGKTNIIKGEFFLNDVQFRTISNRIQEAQSAPFVRKITTR